MPQSHSIQWDESLPPFAGPGSELPDVGYAIEAMADGTNFGNPKELIEIVKSLLSDGSIAVLEGWDNREAPIRLRISAPTAIAGPALAEAEKALMLAVQAKSKAPLVYVPPALDSVACVFDVVAAELTRDVSDGWDEDEVRREYRHYLLTLTCLPFARTEDSVVIPTLGPPPLSPSTTVIDNGSSLTGWSASGSLSGPPPTATVGHGYTRAALTRTGAVSMGSTPYLKITATATFGTPGTAIAPWIEVDGLHRPVVAQSGNVYCVQPPPSFTTVRVTATPDGSYGGPGAGYVRVTEVARTNVLPGAGTTRQQSRSATVVGSAPTQAAIRLWDATPAALGTDILVHSSTNTVWQPALRPYFTGSGTADTAMISGNRNTLASSMTFRIPANRITEGTYALMARMNVTTGAYVSWTAKMVNSAGAATVGSSVVTSGSITVNATGGSYKVVNLAALPLPVLRAEADQMIELILSGNSNMTVDEVWLFGLHDGALTWLQDADSMTWIEIRSPELDATRPSVFGGTGAKGANSVCVDWKCLSFGTHRFEPGVMQVTTITSASLLGQSELEFYPRYHSHVEGSAA